MLFAAGRIKYLVTEAFWARGIRITSAYTANAVPVAEYALSQILFGLKTGWQHVAACRQARRFDRLPVAGGYGSTVGIVSLGAVGRLVVERLRPFDLHVIAYDPYVASEAAAALGVALQTLEDLFGLADVVSVHTPWLKETEGLITGTHIALMKPYATFINTSRGAVVREDEMIAVLAARPDLTAVLDVTYPEPPQPDSALWELPNVLLTLHIAGSVGPECRRMGRLMVEELRRYLAGQPLRHEITPKQAAIMA